LSDRTEWLVDERAKYEWLWVLELHKPIGYYAVRSIGDHGAAFHETECERPMLKALDPLLPPA